MKKIIIAACAAAFLLLFFSAYFAMARLPSLAREQTLQILADYGFQSVILPEPEVRVGAVRFTNIKLDEEGFSTIRVLQIHYSPLGLLFTKKLRAVQITGLNLTGEIAEDHSLGIAGWSKAGAWPAFAKQSPKILTILDSKISLLTRELGGLSLDFEIQARNHNAVTEIQARLTSKQKYASFLTNITGTINPQGQWQADVEIEEGKFDIAHIKATRMNGMAVLSGAPGQDPKIIGEIRAGGMNLYNFPWQNASITVEAQGENIKIFADTKSAGFEGIELGINLQKDQGKTLLSGEIHIPKFSTFIQYLKSRSTQPVNEKALKPLAKKSDVMIEFSSPRDWLAPEKILDYSILDQDKSPQARGKVVISEDGSYTASLVKE